MIKTIGVCVHNEWRIAYSWELSAGPHETKLTRCYFGVKTGWPMVKYGVVTNFGTGNSFMTIRF